MVYFNRICASLISKEAYSSHSQPCTMQREYYPAAHSQKCSNRCTEVPATPLLLNNDFR